MLTLILAPFHTMTTHPGHLQLEVPDSTSIHALRLRLQEHLCYCTDSIALFWEASCNKTSFLPPARCLLHCGLQGSAFPNPAAAQLFYDFTAELYCPVLNADTYPLLAQNTAHQTSTC